MKLGCVAAEGLDYVALGRQTGLMAAKVLKGEAKASDMAYEVISDPSLYVNAEALACRHHSFPTNWPPAHRGAIGASFLNAFRIQIP